MIIVLSVVGGILIFAYALVCTARLLNRMFFPPPELLPCTN